MIRLKIILNQGNKGSTSKTVECDGSITLGQFYDDIIRKEFTEVAECSLGEIQVQFGFPKPQIMAVLESQFQSLGNLGITDRTTLSIQVNPSVSTKAVTSKPKKSKKRKNANDEESEEELAIVYSEDEDQAVGKKKKAKKLVIKQPVRAVERVSISNGEIIRTTSSSSPPKRRKRRGTKLGEASEEDLSELLAKAHSVGSADSLSKAFRKLTKSEILKREAMDLAHKRFVSILGKDYEITSLGGSKIRVVFKKSPQRYETEELDSLSEELLQAFLQHVMDDPLNNGNEDETEEEQPKHSLRPQQVCLSKRIIWSIVHLKGGGENFLFKAYRSLLPQYDWTFVNVRPRKLTEKGKHLKEQLQDDDNPHEEDQVVEEEEEEEDENDPFRDFIDEKAHRDTLYSLGIKTLKDLANVATTNEEDGALRRAYVDAARHRFVSELMEEMTNSDQALLSSLAAVDIQTVSDVARLRIPGRKEYVVSTTKQPKERIEEIMAKAQAIIQKYPWLDLIEFRTRG